MHQTRALPEVKQQLREALAKCKYPNWPINKVQSKYININWEDNNNNNNLQDNNSNQWKHKSSQSRQGQQYHITGHMQSKCKHRRSPHPRQKPNTGIVVIPYMQGIAESFKKICGKYGIQTYFKVNTTVKQVLMKPKDQDPKDKKRGVIYSYQCMDIACGEEYIGETSRTLGER